MKSEEKAELLGRFREVLGAIAQSGPTFADEYVALRQKLVGDEQIKPLLPDFVIERRTARDFWNYIQPAFKAYADRTRYIEAQLLPVERQLRPDRQRAPGERPPEIMFVYSPVRPVSAGSLTLISEDRIAQLRIKTSGALSLVKLVRLCEELNVAYSEGCLFATIALTRNLLDHVPPLFGSNTFSEVANNYGGGGKSFKETMQRLETTARKIADANLHTRARASETLPAPQQVNFSPEIDVLLAEIVRTVV